MKNKCQVLYLFLVLIISPSVQSATLLSSSEMRMYDPVGDLVTISYFNGSGEYTPGESLSALGYPGGFDHFTLEGIQNLTVPMPGPGPAIDQWLILYEQNGISSLSFEAEITLVQTSQNIWETAVLDLDGDGISGTAITDGFLAGFTPNFTLVTAVPIPSAVWLFGSGLIGLLGAAKRKARA